MRRTRATRRHRLLAPVTLTATAALLIAAVGVGRGLIGDDAARTALVPASYTKIAQLAEGVGNQHLRPVRHLRVRRHGSGHRPAPTYSVKGTSPAATTSTSTAAPATTSTSTAPPATTSTSTAAPATTSTSTAQAAIRPIAASTAPATTSAASSVAQQVADLTNAERAKAGCKALTVNPILTSVAQAHSGDMAANNYFSHTDPQGLDPFARMKAAGYSFSTAGENIAAGQQDPAAVMDAWMNSAGHRANILNCSFTEIGVGYATGGSYGKYWTQDFGTPLSTGSTSVPTSTSAPASASAATTTTSSQGKSQTVSTGSFGLGMFMGNFSSSAYQASVGARPKVESVYYIAKSVTTPQISQHEAQIDQGISPLIDLSMKQGPYSQAQVAAWGSDVQAYFKTFAAGLNTLADYAASKNNGTHVYFSYEHEAVVKINQNKYSSGLTPTIAQSAAAWNKVNSYVQTAAPDAVRTYWYGGSGTGEDDMSNALTPSLIQMATFDPYRWSHNKSTDTAAGLWSGTISHLKAQSWMKNTDGTLKPWGLSEWGTDATFGDTSNATFVAGAITYVEAQGASFVNYFDRAEGSNNWVITGGSQPKTLAAFQAAAS